MFDTPLNTALRVLLTIAVNHASANPSKLGSDDLKRLVGAAAEEVDRVLNQMKAAELVVENAAGLRLSRSTRSIDLAQVYAAVTPPALLPKTTFDRFYQAIVEEVHTAVASELSRISLFTTLSDLLKN